MCDPSLLESLPHGRIKNLLDSEVTDGKVVEELFLSTLSRFPNGDEQAMAIAHS